MRAPPGERLRLGRPPTGRRRRRPRVQREHCKRVRILRGPRLHDVEHRVEAIRDVYVIARALCVEVGEARRAGAPGTCERGDSHRPALRGRRGPGIRATPSSSVANYRNGPRHPTLIFHAGRGDGGSRGLNHLAQGSLVRRAIGVHWGFVPALGALHSRSGSSPVAPFGRASARISTERPRAPPRLPAARPARPSGDSDLPVDAQVLPAGMVPGVVGPHRGHHQPPEPGRMIQPQA